MNNSLILLCDYKFVESHYIVLLVDESDCINSNLGSQSQA